MYDNIGKKIKCLAKAVFILFALIPVFIGLSLMCMGNFMMLFGLTIFVAGPIVAWAFSLLFYGFGELIDKTCDIENRIGKTERESEMQSERISKIEKLYSLGLITEDEYQHTMSKK